jgi:hypothetical protein
MLTCPMCKKRLPGPVRQCPTCRTDLSLLMDYVTALDDGLAQAERLTRAGELGEAVWTYLEILEVDPDNATARRQVSRVATAVREFDRAAQGRRWRARLQRRARFREWAHSWGTAATARPWLTWTARILFVLFLLLLGYLLGFRAALDI